MENLPAKKDNHLPSTLIPSKRVVRISEKLLEVNMLLAYRLEGPELVQWAQDIDRLMPTEELEKLPFILDCFKTGEIVYEEKLGIRNIFNATKIVYKEDGKFKIRRAVW